MRAGGALVSTGAPRIPSSAVLGGNAGLAHAVRHAYEAVSTPLDVCVCVCVAEVKSV